MLKLLRRIAILAPTLLATIVVAGAPASATTCPTGGGPLLTIQRCAVSSNSEVITNGFAGPRTYGHFEVWDYHNVKLLANSGDAYWDPGTYAFPDTVPWNARTCIEFWKWNGSTWVRMNNEIDCTSS
jgi:hypothetical protein